MHTNTLHTSYIKNIFGHKEHSVFLVKQVFIKIYHYTTHNYIGTMLILLINNVAIFEWYKYFFSCNYKQMFILFFI